MKRKVQRILIFAGTTEGRELIEYLNDYEVRVTACTATEYGKACIREQENTEVIPGRLEREEIEALICEKRIEIVVDATHPFAVAVTENIRGACQEAKIPYLRCLREQTKEPDRAQDGVVWVDSVAQAAEYLMGTKGNILIATGSKELYRYTELPDWKERCFARVLPSRDAVEECTRLGFEGRHLIAMQGPFTKEMNREMLNYAKAGYFVTKESGKAGGFGEKMQAAKESKAILVVVRRPREEGGKELAQIKKYLSEMIVSKSLQNE